jgi:glycerophosphoryl diester phosphodiesterase
MLRDPPLEGAQPAVASRFLDHDGPIPIAHRGGAGEAPQSSARAIANTAALGFYLETDVAVTRDGVPVLLHPRGLARLQTWRTLGFDAGSRPVVRLAAVLEQYPSLRVLIDVKQWPAVAPTAIAVARAGAAERVSVGTFSQARTDATARAILALTGRHVCTGLGPRTLIRLAFGEPVRPAGGSCRMAQMPYRAITRRFLRRSHAGRIRVIAWTVNEEAEMQRLLDMGVDGIMTDHPSRLRAVLERRGER